MKKGVRTCSIDRNGRLRKPGGRFATLEDAKRLNAERIRRELTRWKGARITRRRA